jgi:hypothetical protein
MLPGECATPNSNHIPDGTMGSGISLDYINTSAPVSIIGSESFLSRLELALRWLGQLNESPRVT